MTPKIMQTKLDQLQARFEHDKELLANEFFEARIVPYCQNKQVSFTIMNGRPLFCDADNNPIKTPAFVLNFFDVADVEGNRLAWLLPSYKYKPEADFNEADKRLHEKTYTGRSLTSLIFSPFFGA